MEGWFNEPKIRKIAFAFRAMRYKTKKAVDHSLFIRNILRQYALTSRPSI
jgi:hypothetical protein